MRRTGLSFQVNLIFSFVVMFASGLFIFILNATLNLRYYEQSVKEVTRHYEQIRESIRLGNEVVPYDFNYLGFSYRNPNYYPIDHNIELIKDETIEELIKRLPYGEINPIEDKSVIIRGYKSLNSNYVIVFYDVDLYTSEMKGNTQVFMIAAFMNIILLGNIIIWLWSGNLLRRIKEINMAVKSYSNQNYEVEVKDHGHDEITDLAEAINEMRLTISEAEVVKRRMLQNVSHDMKTPIAVIQNYAEAIQDGQIAPSEAHIILKHAKLLTDKANKLLELTKIESLRVEIPKTPIVLKEQIEKLINEYYYITPANIKLDLDQSEYYINNDNFQTIFTNILDNAIRYAERDIEITLKDNVLTIYNDGDKISEDFIDKIFNAYEKGSKGQFGLGLAIVYQTLLKFNYTIKVENIRDGVMFTIKPK